MSQRKGRRFNIKGYEELIRKYPLLSDSQERELGWKSINDNDEEARATLACSSIRLVFSIINKSKRFYEPEFKELIQEGYLGLVSAAKSFDPAMGIRFSTWAYPQVLGRIRVYTRKNRWAVRRPESYLNTLYKASRIAENLRKKGDLTHETLTSKVYPDFNNGQRYRYLAHSLIDLVVCDKRDIYLTEVAQPGSFRDRGIGPHERLLYDEEIKTVLELIETLPQREATIIKQRYCLGASGRRTLQKVGESLEKPLSKERVRHIETIALRKIREMIELMEYQ